MNNKALFTGSFDQSNLDCEFVEASAREIDPALEQVAQEKWVEISEKAKKEGKKVWDQLVYRLEGFRIEDNSCTLRFGTIPFSIRYAMNNLTDEVLLLGPKYYPMGAYSSIFIETSSGTYVFSQKSDKYLSRRKYSFIGGVFNKSENDIPTSAEIFDSALNEIKEELSVEEADLVGFRLIGSFINQTCNVCFVFYCKLNISEEDLKLRFAQGHDDEIEKLVFVKRDDLSTFVLDTVGMNDTIVSIYNMIEI